MVNNANVLDHLQIWFFEIWSCSGGAKCIMFLLILLRNYSIFSNKDYKRNPAIDEHLKFQYLLIIVGVQTTLYV